MARRRTSTALVGVLLGVTACADVRPPVAAPLPPTSSIVSSDAPSTAAPVEEAPATPPGDTAGAVEGEGEADPDESGPPPATSTAKPRAAEEKHYSFHDPVPTSLAVDAPALLFANMSASECKAEITKRGIPAEADKKAHDGVKTSMRVTGAMHGVKVSLPGKNATTGVLDCRMVLALDALCAKLAGMDVVRIRIDNVYRPHAKIAGKKNKPSQHSHAMALDVTAFDMADGRTLTPPADWGAAIGDVACGPNAVMESPTENSITLRSLVCAIGRSGLFNTVLSPSFNAAHQSHFHFDLKRDDKHVAIR